MHTILLSNRLTHFIDDVDDTLRIIKLVPDKLSSFQDESGFVSFLVLNAEDFFLT